MYRGERPASDPLPDGVRKDTRKHTRHCLRPTKEMVERFLADPESYPWREFKQDYLKKLRERFAADRGPFDELASLAAADDVFIGCSCPTKKNPDVSHCHTVLALGFMKKSYPKLVVRFP
jgi:uncharacterized protein YeaO (DUF488 family)